MSWELLEPDRIMKITELSDFINTEMPIPKELTSFFGSEGERLAIIYQNREYPSYLETEGGNTKLKWSKVLIRKFGEAFPEYESWFNGDRDESKTPRLELTKSNDVFILRLISENNESSENEGENPMEIAENPEKNESGLSELLKKWIAGYPNFYPRDFRFSFKDVINEDIPKVIESFNAIKSGNYKVMGFAGDTQWAEIPWVKVVDKGIQNISDDGLYLAYILAMDSRKLYLGIIYGAEGVGVRSLSEKASEYRKKIEPGKYQTNHKEVLLANATLVSGIVCFREYTEADMPEDAVLAAEFEDFRKMYQSCLKTDEPVEKPDRVKESAAAIWENPIRSNDRATAEDEIETALIKPTEETLEQEEPAAEAAQKETVEVEFKLDRADEENPDVENSGDSKNEDGENQGLFNREAPDRTPTVSTDGSAENNERQIFQEDLSAFKEQPAESGNESEINEMLTADYLEDHTETKQIPTASAQQAEDPRADKAQHLQPDENEQGTLTQTLTHYPVKNEYLTPYLQLIQAKMGSKGYYYPAELIKTYYLSIKSKPFVMINGRIGSGKTSFPRLFAEAIGANPENGRYKRVRVRKNWDDDTHLFGHLDSRGHFIPGLMTLMLKAAKEYPDKPHFLLLDEMDQSPATDYLGLLLEGINGNKEPFLSREDFGADITAFREYGNLNFPDNLYIIGTINGGTASFPIDSRIIDSGNVITMPLVEIGVFADYGNPSGESEWENSQFKIQSQAKGLPEILEKLMHLLNALQALLITHDHSLGYRGKNEILAFGINSGAEGLFSEYEVIDLAIRQRIMPALAADEKTPSEIYQALACFLLEDGLKETYLADQPWNRFFGRYEALLKAEAIPCPRSGQAILKQLKKEN